MDNPVPIPLRQRYRQGAHYKHNKHTGDRTGIGHRNKISNEAKRRLPPQPKTVKVVNGLTGHGVMVR